MPRLLVGSHSQTVSCPDCWQDLIPRLHHAQIAGRIPFPDCSLEMRSCQQSGYETKTEVPCDGLYHTAVLDFKFQTQQPYSIGRAHALTEHPIQSYRVYISQSLIHPLGEWSGGVAVVGNDLLGVQHQLVGDGEGLQAVPAAGLRPLPPEAGQPHPLEGGALHAAGILRRG